MPVEALKCPMCGAAAASDASRCDHCGARLATVACPSCFGMMFVGLQFCPHCGAKADRQDSAAPAKPQPCPRCKTILEAVVIGGSKLLECPACEGIWSDAETLRQICANQEQQAAVLGMPTHLPPTDPTAPDNHVRYLPCPVCGDLMNRVNFANFSNVIVNVCLQHGTWLDCDELRRIVEFIRAGGMEKARAREIANLEEERRAATAINVLQGHGDAPLQDDIYRHGALSAVARVMVDLLVP
jgi:Zn-finger nucleic acid-binding protein